MTARKAVPVAKGTARRGAVVRLPAVQAGTCHFCPAPATGRYCETCEPLYLEFFALVGGDSGPTVYGMFRMWRSMMERIEDLENMLEIARIRSKYED